MATAATQANGTDRRNWVKGAVALLITKEGLEDFVTDEISQFQIDLLTTICRNIGKPIGTKCSLCTTANILPCPTVGFCTTGGICKMHNPNDPRRQKNVPCKSNICQALRGGIRREHRYFHPSKCDPSWKNADATQFCSDPFQLAKCYMPLDGYSKVQSLTETDFNGVISIVINNKRFQNKLSAKLSQKKNICTEAREIGRLIRHSPNLAISDADLTNYIDTLIDLLSDPKYLANENKAKRAVDELKKQKTAYSLNEKDSKTIVDAILASINSMKDKTKEEIVQQVMEEIKNMLQLSKKEVQDTMRIETEKNIEKLTFASKSLLEEMKVVIKVEREKSIHAIHETAQQKIRTQDKIYTTEKVAIHSEIAYELEQAEEGCTSSKAEEYKTDGLYLRRKQEGLREDLILFYQEYYSTFLVTTLIGKFNIPLLQLYAHQKLESVEGINSKAFVNDQSASTTVKTYKELFFCGNETYKNIYITAKHGAGKTLFSMIICHSWCQAYKPVEGIHSKFQKENLEAIRHFDFVFFVSLDTPNSSACEVDDLIEIQIIRKLSRQHQYTKHFLVDILRRKKCLIILDGLNQWFHLERVTGPYCTTMTTALPWKFDIFRKYDRQVARHIDRHIHICELNEQTTAKLVENMISFLNERYGYKKSPSSKEVQKALTEKSMSDEPFPNPYIVLQFACLLYKGESIDRFKCEIYSSMVELRLSTGELRLSTGRKHVHNTLPYAERSTRTLPRIFTTKTECQTNFGILLCIGRLAFETLFGDDRAQRLRFTNTVAKKYISLCTLDVILKLGLLTQDRNNEISTVGHLSFENYTMHAYFAALHIQAEQTKAVKDRISNECQSLQTIFRMYPMFEFISGFDQALASDLLSECILIASKDDKLLEVRRTSSFRRCSFENKEQVKNLQSLIIKSEHCGIKLPIQDIIIDTNSQRHNNLDVLTSLIERNVNYHSNLKSLSIHECPSTDAVNKILQQLNTRNLHHLRKLMLMSIPNTINLHSLLRGSKHSLRCLELCSFEYKNATQKYYHKVIDIPSDHIKSITFLPFLGVLNLESLRISHDDLSKLLRFLSTRTEMKEIILFRLICNKCTSYGDHSLNLFDHKKLETLGLHNVPLSKLRLNATNQLLEECWIGKLPSGILSAVFAYLGNAPNLHALHCLKLDDLEAMLQSIPNLRCLKYISFQYIDFGNRVISLTSNTKDIQHISLNRVKLSSEALQKLIDTIKTLPHEVDIRLTNCRVAPLEEYEKVKCSIRDSKDINIIFDGRNIHKERVFQFYTVNDGHGRVQSRNAHAMTSSRTQAITSISEQILYERT